MGAEQRRAEILRLATDRGPAGVAELAERFGVTASTIRRDLARLSGTGRLARTYGGAMAVPESSLRQRGGEAAEAKRSIAGWAAGRIEPGTSVLLDAGSTVAQVARLLPAGLGVTVTTASIPVIGQLHGRGDVATICLGGRVRALSDAFVGPLTEAALERLSFDVAFLGADGVTSDSGLCEAEPEQTRLKELMARRSRQVYVLAHAAKLNHRPFHAWARLDRPWTLVTDVGAPDEVVAEFRAGGVEVVVVPSGRP
ncbi:DeoR/GlpR family DNA-binding transcription regulator [Microlunatus parietis]|uniref:Lactose phosphotransferase system repressor n=1 Tax=Microlunatus parietis TaxID=682979 RepID=A0A7Y9LER0_9ACTN|nr:DeoR/GlpR family DNA-binding transcription regulator [Microlunatus parietis]NYE74098.1 DeoR/GlpR family transcriptional regulator of sugar metabolism [Microlunatus parietis]